MALLESLLVRAERHLGGIVAPALSPFLHRRHGRTLREAAVDPVAAARARSAWWADDSRWFAGGTPPREHNRITPLIDGDAFFTRLYTALTGAQRYVYIAGWCVTPYVPLLRGSTDDLLRTRLLGVLSTTADRVPVRILLWGGAPFVIQPTRRVVRATQKIFQERGTGDLRCVLDETAQMSHCHHQKTIVVDGELAFVGGMDLTTFAGDRWDDNAHGLRAGVNWHDVEALVEGETVADVEANFRERWEAVTGDTTLPHNDPRLDPSWSTRAQIVRTIPRGRYDFAPRGEFGIHHAYVEAIRRAQRFIYLETQYLWSPDVMDALIDVMNAPHDEPFRIVIVLPARATSGKWDNDDHVEQLRTADNGRGIAEVYSLYDSGPTNGVRPFRYRPTYVHAKVGIIDDDWCSIGSANLNTRGMVTDSEINVVAIDNAVARDLRLQLWAEHLGTTKEAIANTDPVRLIDTLWKERAQENAAVIRSGVSPLFSQAHRYEPGRVPGTWLLEESEMLTFEH
jgi:phosphatidylserine/phosphatidylglycerophosphate/cardiolipin synthase-like enzyme